MSRIHRKGVVQGGQVFVEEPINLPDGSEVTILGEIHDDFPGGGGDGLPPAAAEIDFMTEDDQGDDPEGIDRWVEDLRSIPPVPEDPGKEAARRAWDEAMRRFNIDAVRKQFEEGPS